MITSLDNKQVKQFYKLHQKKYRNGQYLLLDKKMIDIAYKTNYLETLIYVDELPFEFSNCLNVSRDVLNKIAKSDNLDYIGVGKNIEFSDEYKNRVMILDHLQDPLNIGRIMESAYIFGFDSIIMSNDCADIYNEKCLSASKGAIYNLNICIKDLGGEIKKLQSLGFEVIATGLKDNTVELYDVKPSDKMAFILGNEGSGVDHHLMDISDKVMKIDMVNIDSLNVAMAGSIIMYQFKI